MDYQALYRQAHAAGMAAGQGAAPVPMMVYSPVSLFNDAIDHSQPVYHVPDGVCGFAYVQLPKAVGPFVKFLKERKIGFKRCGAGYSISVHEFGQSLQRKEAYANAFAKVLNAHGVDSYVDSRMD